MKNWNVSPQLFFTSAQHPKFRFLKQTGHQFEKNCLLFVVWLHKVESKCTTSLAGLQGEAQENTGVVICPVLIGCIGKQPCSQITVPTCKKGCHPLSILDSWVVTTYTHPTINHLQTLIPKSIY